MVWMKGFAMPSPARVHTARMALRLTRRALDFAGTWERLSKRNKSCRWCFLWEYRLGPPASSVATSGVCVAQALPPPAHTKQCSWSF